MRTGEARDKDRHDLVAGDLAEHRIVGEQGARGRPVKAMEERRCFDAGLTLGHRRVTPDVCEQHADGDERTSFRSPLDAALANVRVLPRRRVADEAE